MLLHESNQKGRRSLLVAVCATLGALILATVYVQCYAGDGTSTTGYDGESAEKPLKEINIQNNLHIVLPASSPDINLCKTLLSLKILGYPAPILSGWGEAFDDASELGGGSHLAKISDTLRYLERADIDEDDIMLLTDAYDVWFQLTPDVMLSRYQRIVADSNRRLYERIGADAVRAGAFRDSIVFGAGKRCAPNQPHTVACYAAPPSPVRADLYGNNTDTIMGWNKYSSARQRWLNSGLIMGPVGAMRSMFKTGERIIEDLNGKESKVEDQDNGSGLSVDFYHGSDQSIFAMIFGRQEYSREWMKRERAGSQKTLGIFRGKYVPRTSSLEGTRIDDILNPSFAHQVFNPASDPAGQWENQITLDYHSDLIHQTVNSERDGQWLRYVDDLKSQVAPRTSMFECEPRFPKLEGSDVRSSRVPFLAPRYEVDWLQVPLYTHLCLSTIPVIIHHNGVKERRDYDWNRVWFFHYLADIMSEIISEGEGSKAAKLAIARTTENRVLTWRDMCPKDWDSAIFGQ